MNNKYQQIDRFLKIWRDAALENPSMDFSSQEIKNTIYHYLVRLNVNSEQQDMKIDESCFLAWINRFKNIKNIDCFVNPRWTYFCQFTNKGQVQNERIKIYIPLDAEHIYQGANMIFDFLAKNNIVHQSKIGKHIRFDDIVIRLDNKEDYEKLNKFINDNQYIKEGLIQPNPFAYNKDGIALACDGGISYNSTVAELINIYINEKKQNNILNTVDVKDFYIFLADYYNKIFINHDYDKFVSDFDIKDFDEYDYEFTNYKQVLGLIIKSADINFTFTEFLKHFEMCKEGKENTNYLEKDSKKNLDINEGQPINDYIERLLLETIQVMSGKYGRNNAINGIKGYLTYGNIAFITRDHGLRDKIVGSRFREHINEWLHNSKLSLEENISLLEQKYQINSNDLKSSVEQNEQIKSKEDILLEALMITYEKYERQCNAGKDYMVGALEQLIFRNSYLGFTRYNKARKSVSNNLTREDIINILKEKYGYNEITYEILKSITVKYVDDIISWQNKR